MALTRKTGNLIIGGRTFNVNAPVVNWHENGWDATSAFCMSTKTDPKPPCEYSSSPPGNFPYGLMPLGRYLPRYATRPALRTTAFNNGFNPSYEAARAVIKKFVIHFDGCATADMCWSVLQNERGLSVHFLLDNDGTIYQTLDLALMGFHASEFNGDSIGVELCSRGDARNDGGFYAARGMKRETKGCRINGHNILAWEYTPEQYDAMDMLAKELLRLLPNIPADYPQSSPGVQVWDTLPSRDSWNFNGYLGHYHLTTNKWDPGPWNFKDFIKRMRGAFTFPVFPRGAPDKDKDQDDKPNIPTQVSELHAQRDLLYGLNEQKADGGYYPLGPWGEARIWHGGVHLAGKEGAQVFAPFPARLVAARMGASSTPIGSVNFVLLRHQMSVGARKVEFYSLYMHLADELTAEKPPEWVTKARLDKDGKPRAIKAGEVLLLDEAIEAGSYIGRMGKAGPADLSRTQVHHEIFSVRDLFDGYPGSPWIVVDGTSGGRFSETDEINSLIDQNKDGILTKAEVTQFFQNGNGAALRFHVVRHVSEWHGDPSWSDALRQPKDFKTMKPDEIDAMVADQITPSLWWTDEVATHCRLPHDAVVYHYHPISFTSWFNQMLIEAPEEKEIDKKDTRDVPPGVTDDFGDKDGSSMRSADVFLEDPCNEKLNLKDMVLGYEAPECQ
ncbi:MAG: N-acetylmuramoyl-L-alanine amidase [Deltaproteobacteria bacterium]|nr:N-acetylmuramoyl-L-alanine amidase [Deltaproteobacteria bacterium]